jgi:hypothetical protein
MIGGGSLAILGASRVFAGWHFVENLRVGPRGVVCRGKLWWVGPWGVAFRGKPWGDQMLGQTDDPMFFSHENMSTFYSFY